MTESPPVQRIDGAHSRRRMLSILMPARNEELNLVAAYHAVTSVMSTVNYDYEVIIIDNASSDTTGQVAQRLVTEDTRWRYIRFSRNFHVESSLSAGMRLAGGDAVITLFSDLQDPPELIPEFLRRFEEGFDIVFGVVDNRGGDPWWKAFSARLLYQLINRLADVDIPCNATDFRLLSRRAVDALNLFDERNRYLRGLTHWIGFRQCPISYNRRPRAAGQSKAPFLYMLNLAANAITCFTIRPLQLFSLLGVATTALTCCLAFVYLVGYLCGYTLPGLTTIYLLLLAILAVLLLGFGALGEYTGRIYLEVKQRPLFLIEHACNVNIPAGNRHGHHTHGLENAVTHRPILEPRVAPPSKTPYK